MSSTRRSGGRLPRWLLPLSLLLAAAAAPPAAATPADDYAAVAADYQGDRDVTACRFTRAQLVGAASFAGSVGDLESYAPGFGTEVTREIARHDNGGCRGVMAPTTGRASSPLRRVRIVRIRPKGESSESVTIRNTGSRSVNLGGATLRDRRNTRLRIPRRTRLRGRRSLRIVTGCAAGRRRAVRRGGSLYLCRRSGVWDDRGDVVKVVDSRGRVVAQRGYGTFRRVVRF